MMQALVDLLGSFVYIVILGNETVNHMEDVMLPVLCTAVFLSFWLEFAAALFYSRRRRKGAKGKESFAVAAAAMLVILLYVLMLAYGMYFWQGNYTSAFMTIVWVSVGGTAGILIVCLFSQKKQKKENRMEWENLIRLRQSQEDFFCRLAKLEKETSFIRHDHLNVLGTISQLLEQSQSAEAKEVLESYLNRPEGSESRPAEEKGGNGI